MKMKGMRVLMFVENVFEDMELLYPYYRLIEEGAEVVVAGPESGTVYTGKNGYPFRSTAAIADQQEDDFDLLVIAGGFAPDKLRRDAKVLELTRKIHEAGKIVAHICHGGWIPISAGIMKGFTCTSTPGIKDDLINAGATWVDKEVVVDRNQISSRKPDDLPAFCRAIVDSVTK
ncbi:type 1 glutamine amidotransferase domain-containing protein [Maridesulfovibrio ferrireducens]|uniref:type 1 glutamine amidotransferase domain-containing protein n=1 Tax=Maridesulfovibrio ferrireducens TaxID=246191 RepID=UPI001A203C25|nr:type 1 glutamine amidotransferase domain-containing protein [Maridesulfovibrio ferrireducens]MBI9110064.1 type 1 glutamine amidotransferase [Maridesulfovibrio ferrireducens]